MKHIRLLPVILFIVLSMTTRATHVTGGDISYCCVGQDSFMVTLNLFRDCSGIQMPNNVVISASSTCGNTTANMQLQNNGGTEVSQLCAQDLPNSNCNNGFLPGFQLYTYRGLVTLTPCADWFIAYSLCCRNTTQNLQGQPVFFIDAFLNSILAPCNSSPIFTDFRVPYFCINQPAVYDFGIIQGSCGDECNPDSLSFALVSAKEAQLTPVTYLNPYTGSVPMANITIDPVTGKLSFIPNVLGKFVVVVEVSEWNNNNLIANTRRDVNFVVINCTNQVPDGDVPLSNLTGSATQLDSTTIEICSGDQFCFDVVVSDPDNGQTVTLISNVSSVLQGATFTTTPGNPATATICWSAGDCCTSRKAFTVTALDNACPINGVSISTFGVKVLESTYAGQDIYLCRGGTAQFNVCGGTQFTWTSVSGDSLIVGTNFSCDTCANPTAWPDTTTTYVVTSNFTGGCDNVDTVIVYVTNPNPSISGLLTVNEFDTTNYSVPFNNGSSYLWTVTGGLLLNGQWTNSIDVSWGSSGTGTVCVIETDSTGCVGDTVCVQVTIDATGIEEQTPTGSIQVFPNPFTEETEILFEYKSGADYRFELIDMAGKLVMKKDRLTSGSIILQRNNLRPGVYTVRIVGPESYRQKIVIE